MRFVKLPCFDSQKMSTSTRAESFVGANESLASSPPAYNVSRIELGRAIDGETNIQ
jgi:hypothetical protein